MSNKASLTSAELEFTQRMQIHFPRGLSTEILGIINSCPVAKLTSAIEKMIEELAAGVESADKLLEYITSVKVSAIECFVAADHFKAGQIVDEVRYSSSFGSNFVANFLPKVESNVPATDLRVHKLLRNSTDLGIRTEIGEDREETHLTNIHELLKLQGNGQEGVLLIDGRANIFYVRDTCGILWAVGAGWCGGGWFLGAGSVEDPRGWIAGHRVFFR